MSARDDFGSRAGTPGGYGGAGGLGNGGVAGGMNGGAGSRTGLTTGTQWNGNTAFGPAGGGVQAYGMRDPRSLAAAGMGPTMGQFSNFRTPQGQAMFPGMPGSFGGMNMGQALGQAQQQWGLMQQLQKMHSTPAGQPMGPATPSVQPPLPEVQPPIPPTPYVPGSMAPWPGQSAIPNNPPVYTPPSYVPGSMAPWPGQSAIPNNPPVYTPPPQAALYRSMGPVTTPATTPGSVHYQTGSTMYKNNQGVYPGNTVYKNNQGTGLGGGSTMYKNNQGDFGGYGRGSTHYKDR